MDNLYSTHSNEKSVPLTSEMLKSLMFEKKELKGLVLLPDMLGGYTVYKFPVDILKGAIQLCSTGPKYEPKPLPFKGKWLK